MRVCIYVHACGLTVIPAPRGSNVVCPRGSNVLCGCSVRACAIHGCMVRNMTAVVGLPLAPLLQRVWEHAAWLGEVDI